MESYLRALGGEAVDEALDRAQALIYDAWEIGDGRRRMALARHALKISPLCADAYVILAERPSISLKERRDLFERGVKAGEMTLGPEGFEEFAGHFWGFLETRPYMRARAGLAQTLWAEGRHDEAIAHCREMLDLNPGDNQGIRRPRRRPSGRADRNCRQWAPTAKTWTRSLQRRNLQPVRTPNRSQ